MISQLLRESHGFSSRERTDRNAVQPSVRQPKRRSVELRQICQQDVADRQTCDFRNTKPEVGQFRNQFDASSPHWCLKQSPGRQIELRGLVAMVTTLIRLSILHNRIHWQPAVHQTSIMIADNLKTDTQKRDARQLGLNEHEIFNDGHRTRMSQSVQ